MAELRIIYDRTEGDALDVFAWLAEAHPRALAGYGSSLKRLAPEVRPDEYIDLRTPTLGLKLRGGFGKRQQGLELKTCQSKDSTTGVEIWTKQRFGGVDSNINAYSPGLAKALLKSLRSAPGEVHRLLEGIEESELPKRICRIDKSRQNLVIPINTITSSFSGHVEVEQADFELQLYELEDGRVSTKGIGNYRSICFEGGGKEALAAVMNAFFKENAEHKSLLNHKVMGYPEWLCHIHDNGATTTT